MKKIFLISCLAIGAYSCSSDTSNSSSSEKTITSNFVKDISSLEDLTSKTPIKDFVNEANTIADSKLVFTKENIKNVLVKAESYKNTVIVIEDHTIVKIANIKDCKQSGSWGACMPMGKGFIKKGDLVGKKDYINNIIGLPDDQVRTAYFFN